MGFRVHPGPLPFFTIRDADKWEPRLANGQIEIVGEGCDMPAQMVRVAEVEPYDPSFHGPVPAHVADLYKGKRLVAVWLDSLRSSAEEVRLPPMVDSAVDLVTGGAAGSPSSCGQGGLSPQKDEQP